MNDVCSKFSAKYSICAARCHCFPGKHDMGIKGGKTWKKESTLTKKHWSDITSINGVKACFKIELKWKRGFHPQNEKEYMERSEEARKKLNCSCRRCRRQWQAAKNCTRQSQETKFETYKLAFYLSPVFCCDERNKKSLLFRTLTLL